MAEKGIKISKKTIRRKSSMDFGYLGRLDMAILTFWPYRGHPGCLKSLDDLIFCCP